MHVLHFGSIKDTLTCNVNLHVCADLDAAEHAQAHVLMEGRTFSTLVKMQNFNRVDLFARYLFFFFTRRCKNQRSLIF